MVSDSESLLLNALHRKERDKEAVVFKGRRISYGSLSDSVSRIMTFLDENGVGKGDRVAIWLTKTPESIFLLLATLGVGAAYIPIDPGSPKARVITLLEDSKPVFLFTSENNLDSLKDTGTGTVRIVGLKKTEGGYDLAELQSSGPHASLAAPEKDDLAAILYTSGSTGTPKGVMLSHGNISTFVAWAAETFGLRQEDRFTSHAPFHFDLSTFDLFAAFNAGGTVCLLDDIMVKFPGTVLGLLREERITVWYSVPTALRMLVEHGRDAVQQLKSLRLVLFAGEVFQPAALRAVMAAFSQARFFNLYGPTETNVCTYYEVPRPLPSETFTIPIGVPCPPLEVGIYDPSGHPVPPGERGEICVTGPGVMLGYFNDEELTARKRLGERKDSYRTGDHGYRSADGNIIFTGREDNQVKFRGHRIELLEIEAVIAAHPDIREAAVLVLLDDTGEQVLRAAVTAKPGSTKPGNSVLARHIAARLPSYCVPGEIVWLEDMPRTSTGKVDRNRLKEQ